MKGIWSREWFTNNGPLLRQLETDLQQYLGSSRPAVVSNGTIALQIAIKALELKGEIITTPFSYIATTSSIIWEGCMPVFADIQPDTFNIDPEKIEEVVTSATTAILATHVFGNPCDVETIESIARRHGLKVIYDGAHGFGVRYKSQSIYSYGDISTASFHATKLFHTIEGGALFADDESIMKRIELMRNFGHNGPHNFAEAGINGKNSEVHAAMGILMLQYIDTILEKRKEQYLYYRERLKNFPAIYQIILPGTTYNYSYFPIVLNNPTILEKVEKVLIENDISPRRYFYPSLSDLSFLAKHHNNTPNCRLISDNILCLPLYHTLSVEEIDRVCDTLYSAI